MKMNRGLPLKSTATKRWQHDLQRAWLAGIIDGEGTIYHQRRSLTMRVAMTHEPTIQHIRDIVGVGGVSYQPSPDKRWKSSWVWYVHGKRVQRILRSLIPLLVTKKRHALIALEYPVGKGRSYSHPLARYLQEECIKALKRANHRGPWRAQCEAAG